MVTAQHPRLPSSRVWFVIAVVAAAVTLVAGAQWWRYESALSDAARDYRFNTVEVGLTQPPFDGIVTQIDGDKWLPDGPRDIVRDPESIALYETITLTLKPLTTGSGCSNSPIDSYQVLVDAPGFTVDKIGDATRSRQMLLAPQCDLSSKEPPPAPAWRWNLMANLPGNHVITLVLQAMDKNSHVLDSREVDIPVVVPEPPQPLSANIGLIGAVVTVATGMIGLWERFKRKPPPSTPEV